MTQDLSTMSTNKYRTLQSRALDESLDICTAIVCMHPRETTAAQILLLRRPLRRRVLCTLTMNLGTAGASGRISDLEVRLCPSAVTFRNLFLLGRVSWRWLGRRGEADWCNSYWKIGTNTARCAYRDDLRGLIVCSSLSLFRPRFLSGAQASISVPSLSLFLLVPPRVARQARQELHQHDSLVAPSSPFTSTSIFLFHRLLLPRRN